jgi:hypothetical protein
MGASGQIIVGKNVDHRKHEVVVGKDGYFGSSDADYQSGAGTITRAIANGGYAYIVAHTDSVCNITSTDITGSMTAVNIPAGMHYRCGRATSITVASGEITAYYAAP